MNLKKLFRILAVACTLSLIGAVIPATPASAVPFATLVLSSDPSGSLPVNSGRPGMTVYLNGTVSIAPGAPIALSITSTPAGISGTGFVTTGQYLSASQTSSVPITLTIPTGTPRTTFAISVISTGGQYTGVINFDILPRLIVTPVSGTVGSPVTITGDAFQAFGNVSLFWDSDTVAFNTTAPNNVPLTANAQGVLAAATVKIPAGYRGPHNITAMDGIGLVEPVSFSVASNLVIDPVSGGSGDVVKVTGTGFASSAQVSIRFDSQVMTTVSTDQNGGFGPTSITIPTVTRGSHTVTAQDTQTVSATFTVGEKIVVTPTSGFVGDTTVNVTGSGYDPNQPVQLYWDVTPLAVTPAPITTSGGNFSASFPIPATFKGAHTVRVQIGSVISTATVTVNSKITGINPTSGQVGSSIKLSGTGFTPSSSVAINFDGVSSGTLTVGDNGSFTDVPVTIPASAYGQHTVSVQGVSFSVTTTSKITISPTSGVYNDDITVTGSGFNGSSTITLSIDNAYSLTSSTITVAANGAFTATFKIPGLTKGNHVIKAADLGGGSAEATLTINPKITIAPTSGVPGDQVTITGTGFAPTRVITVTYNNSAVTTNPVSITTDDKGNFAALFTVIASQAGTIIVTVSDGAASLNANFTALPKATISPITSDTSPGNVGQDITLAGTGFKPDTTVNVILDNVTAPVASTMSTAQGSFTVTFKSPAIVKGSHIVKITDGTTTKEFTYIMEGAKPPAPALLGPTQAAKPKQPITFSWNPVTDLSGVTYVFQISQDPQFATLIKEPKAQTTTSYTMTEAEKLPSAGGKTPYLWRVRAIDGAGNLSDWSEIRTFNIGSIWPSWMIHVWYGFGILIALILGLWWAAAWLTSHINNSSSIKRRAQ